MKMSFKKASATVLKNKGNWAFNLPKSSASNRRVLPRMESLGSCIRLPTKVQVLGRYHTLFEKEKQKKIRIQIIRDELLQLWKKFSFPCKSKQAIFAQLEKLVTNYEKYQRKPDEIFAQELQNIFDVTQPGGTWLCNEDKEFYCKQIETNGIVGYTTLKPASLSTIHPSKRPRIEKSASSATKVQIDSILQIDCDSDASVDGSSYCESSSSESSSSDSQSQMKRSSTI